MRPARLCLPPVMAMMVACGEPPPAAPVATRIRDKPCPPAVEPPKRAGERLAAAMADPAATPERRTQEAHALGCLLAHCTTSENPGSAAGRHRAARACQEAADVRDIPRAATEHGRERGRDARPVPGDGSGGPGEEAAAADTAGRRAVDQGGGLPQRAQEILFFDFCPSSRCPIRA